MLSPLDVMISEAIKGLGRKTVFFQILFIIGLSSIVLSFLKSLNLQIDLYFLLGFFIVSVLVFRYSVDYLNKKFETATRNAIVNFNLQNFLGIIDKSFFDEYSILDDLKNGKTQTLKLIFPGIAYSLFLIATTLLLDSFISNTVSIKILDKIGLKYGVTLIILAISFLSFQSVTQLNDKKQKEFSEITTKTFELYLYGNIVKKLGKLSGIVNFLAGISLLISPPGLKMPKIIFQTASFNRDKRI